MTAPDERGTLAEACHCCGSHLRYRISYGRRHVWYDSCPGDGSGDLQWRHVKLSETAYWVLIGVLNDAIAELPEDEAIRRLRTQVRQAKRGRHAAAPSEGWDRATHVSSLAEIK